LYIDIPCTCFYSILYIIIKIRKEREKDMRKFINHNLHNIRTAKNFFLLFITVFSLFVTRLVSFFLFLSLSLSLSLSLFLTRFRGGPVPRARASRCAVKKNVSFFNVNPMQRCCKTKRRSDLNASREPMHSKKSLRVVSLIPRDSSSCSRRGKIRHRFFAASREIKRSHVRKNARLSEILIS